MTSSCILFATSIEDSGQGKALTGEAVSETLRADKLAWVHLDGTNPQTRTWLEREVPYLDALIINALLAPETRPRCLEFETGIMLILRGVNLNDQAKPEDMISLRLWVDDKRIITVQLRRLKAVQDIREQLEAGHGPRNAGDFIGALAARLLERMEPTFAALDETLDDLEETILESPEAALRKDITELRKQAIVFRRYIQPQKDALAQLRNVPLDWINPIHKRHIQETIDRCVRYIEDLDEIRERAQVVKDELTNSLSDRMNKNLYVLSVIAAIFLPLGFLTGLLGINVGGIPGADSADSFVIFCILLGIITAVQIAVFRFFKWI